MSAGELVEVVLEGHGFTFTVVKLPREVIIDKLALVSPSTGSFPASKLGKDFINKGSIPNIAISFLLSIAFTVAGIFLPASADH